ncbi:MAG: formate/nitrite transporter family protein [Aerococcaceae bacterium]|nr:formate/nitrite transporter family protein [Aerococcaceae bacterium]
MGTQLKGLMGTIEYSVNKKEELFQKSKARYFTRAILACVFLSLGVAVSCYVADKANHIVHDGGKFLYAFMFSWSLVMITYMNAELGTSNMMYLTAGVHRKFVSLSTAAKILLACVALNFVGAVLTTYVISLSDAYSHVGADHYLIEATVAKLAKSPLTQFAEGILANILVNVAVFCGLRMKDDAGKVIAIVFIIYIFAFLGFEHVIANFSLFSLAYWTTGGAVEGMTLGNVLSNFLFSGLGNYVGGGICVGLLYSWLNQKSELYYD